MASICAIAEHVLAGTPASRVDRPGRCVGPLSATASWSAGARTERCRYSRFGLDLEAMPLAAFDHLARARLGAEQAEQVRAGAHGGAVGLDQVAGLAAQLRERSPCRARPRSIEFLFVGRRRRRPAAASAARSPPARSARCAARTAPCAHEDERWGRGSPRASQRAPSLGLSKTTLRRTSVPMRTSSMSALSILLKPASKRGARNRSATLCQSPVPLSSTA